MESSVGSDGVAVPGNPALEVRMLGPLVVRRGGAAVELPASRKVRALFAYLALTPRAVTRSQLCELLWELPSDPRGELRWSLAKVRRIVDDPGRARVHAHEDALTLDLADCFVDALEVARASEQGIGTLPLERVRSLCALYEGDLLQGLEIERSPAFGGWLTAQRRRFRALQVALLEHFVARVGDEEAFAPLEQWVQLAPFDQRAHALLLETLARCGRVREGEEHVSRAAALFASEGLDFMAVREAWRRARAQSAARANATDAGSIGPNAAVVAPAAKPGGSGSHGIAAAAPPPGVVAAATRRASIAVMPFVGASAVAGAHGGMGDALAHDVITRLAKLRSLFVIAQGSVFALRDGGTRAEDAGRMLDVDYIVSGAVRASGGRLVVTVELTETRTAHIVWAEMFDEKRDDAFVVLEEIGNRIVGSIASEIELVERNRAILKPPNSLNAWEAHHRGLWHMYRFTKADNEQAQQFFQRAVQLDPTFARAHAGLSFTHWQNAFQDWSDRDQATRQAFAAAGEGLLADDRDPAAHWAMGRALWLRGEHDPSVTELQQALELSPNFALGHYTVAFVQSQAGDPLHAISASDHSRHLSPYDPLLFGMLGARAMALVRLGRFDEAAHWATKAALRPNAHAHIFAIAAFSLALAGSLDEALAHATAIRRMVPTYGFADFLRAFRFDAEGEALFRKGAKRIGMA